MAFRFFKSVVPRETNVSSLVVVSGDKLVVQDLDVALPRSCDYSLKDLLAAGVPVPPVDSTILHDNSSTLAVADALVNQSSVTPSVNVEPSNND
jgi:hypothetical protein